MGGAGVAGQRSRLSKIRSLLLGDLFAVLAAPMLDVSGAIGGDHVEFLWTEQGGLVSFPECHGRIRDPTA